MEVDGGALIRPRAVSVDLSGRTYRIPALPAASWMLILLERGWADVVPGMLDGDDLDALHDEIADGTVGALECERAAQDAVSAAAGTDWWVAVRLLHSAAADPGAMGELRMSGIDPETAPLGAALVALYRIYTRDRERKDVAKVDAELNKPPEGMTAAQARYDEDAAAAQFERQYAARGGQ